MLIWIEKLGWNCVCSGAWNRLLFIIFYFSMWVVEVNWDNLLWNRWLK
jgi:hypothetical protein